MVKYRQISEIIRKRIMNKEYSADEPIPNEISLAEEFGCSRMTIKKALDELVMRGLLYRKRGHGTFIVKSAVDNDLINVTVDESVGLTNLLKLQGKKVTSKILKFEVKFPAKEVADQLSIDSKTPVYEIMRLRYVEGEPYVIEHTYMPASLITGINEEVLHSSIYRHITETLKLTMGGSFRKVRACKPNEWDIKYLECAPDDPVLEVEQIGYLNTGVPFEYSFSRHRYDKFVFTSVNIRRN